MRHFRANFDVPSVSSWHAYAARALRRERRPSERRVILRGGEWDGFLIPESLGTWWRMVTMEPKAASTTRIGESVPGIDYERTDDWEDGRRVYRVRVLAILDELESVQK